MSSLVYLKQPQDMTRTEMLMESLDSISVHHFKELVSKKVMIPSEQLILMYGGRVLSSNATLDYYNIVNGVTIYYLKKRDSVNMEANVRQTSQLKRLIKNPRLTRVLSNPLLLSSVTRGTPLENHPGILSLSSDEAARTDFSDPETLIRHLDSDPSQANSIEAILKLIGAAVAEERGCTNEEVEDEDIVDMLEQSLEDSMEFIEEDNQELVDAQEQMYQHSQSILAHQQSNTNTQSSAIPYIRQSDPSNTIAGAVSPTITQNMLASALATTIPPNHDGPRSLPSNTTYLSPPRPSHTGPPFSSLPSTGVSTSGPSNLPGSGPSSLPGSGPSSLSSTGPSVQYPMRSVSDSRATIGTFSQEDLQRALQSVATTSQGAATPQSFPSSSRHSHRSGRHQRYQTQLQRLFAMGITDEAACLHALDATNGDLNAAIELLLGTGQ